jgi:hypothetical protein
MTSQAVANRRLVHVSFDLRRILVGMASQAQLRRGCRRQLDPGHIFIYADFMAAQAAGLHGGMHRLAFGLIVVALQAGGRIRVFIQRNRMYFGERFGESRSQNQETQRRPEN